MPGPRGVELWRRLVQMRHRPHERLLDLALEYGDYVLLAFPGEHVVLVSSPAGIEHILHHRHHNYDKQTSRWEGVRRIWGNGLLTAEGDLWRRQRQRMQPAFHQEALKQFAGMVVEEAQRVAADWHASAAMEQPRDVYTDMLRCAVRAITRASFGSDVEGKTDQIIHALEQVNDYINPMSLPNLLRVPVPLQRFTNPSYLRFRTGHRALTGILQGIVARRAGDAQSRADLLGMLMCARDEESSEVMTSAQMYDEMMNILIAGHETTGIATAWCWYWLSQHPGVERDLHAEIDRVVGDRPPTYDDLPALMYTRMVFEETMRITPSVWAYDRRAREEDVVEGYRIPKDTKIALSPYVMHHHPKYWDRPDHFNPLRFLPEEAAKRPQYAFFPFGGGPRRCIGFRFAMLEGQLIIATLAQSFRTRLKPGHPVEPVARLNFPPKFGLQMYLEPRRALTPASASA
jgi:cytochrome P450